MTLENEQSPEYEFEYRGDRIDPLRNNKHKLEAKITD